MNNARFKIYVNLVLIGNRAIPRVHSGNDGESGSLHQTLPPLNHRVTETPDCPQYNDLLNKEIFLIKRECIAIGSSLANVN